MAYIDPDGMFGGDRMQLLSDAAKLAWPWFWVAANTMGRIELNYQAFIRGPFRQFRTPPNEEDFWNWAAEFHESFLMFCYQAQGSAWGQFDVSERYLPDYKKAADRRTPAPIAASFLAWRDEYRSQKASNLTAKCRVFNNSENILSFSENSKIFPLGRGIGSGEDKFKSIGATAPKEGQLFPSDQAAPAVAEPDGFEAFWKVWWNKAAKADAKKAFGSAAKRYGVAFLVGQVAEDRQRWEGTDSWAWRSKLHPATWLRNARWEDQLPPVVGGKRRSNDMVADVTGLIESRLSKGEKPW